MLYRAKRVHCALAMFAVLSVSGCDETSPTDQGKHPATATEPASLRIGYRSSVPIDVGPLWAHELHRLRESGVESTVQNFTSPEVLLESLRENRVDLVTAVPLDLVFDDIRIGRANYLIFCLLCCSPDSSYDAIVVRKPSAEGVGWQSLAGQNLGVAPGRQATIIGRAILKSAAADMSIQPYSVGRALSELDSGKYGAVHLFGPGVVEAQATPQRYTLLEVAPAARRAFNGRVAAAWAGLIRREWAKSDPLLATRVLIELGHSSRLSRHGLRPPMVSDMLRNDAYGGFDVGVAERLPFAEYIETPDIEAQHFAPLLDLLKGEGVPVPSVDLILSHVLQARR